MLRLNLALNGVDDRVRALPVAVSRHDGGLELVVDRAGAGNRWIADDSSGPGEDPASDDGTTILRVEAVTLDQLIDRGVIDAERVGLPWLDTNGHERHVLEGGSRLPRRGVPLVLRCASGDLDRASDGGSAASIIGEHYTHFVDLGHAAMAAPSKAKTGPSASGGWQVGHGVSATRPPQRRTRSSTRSLASWSISERWRMSNAR